MALMKSAENRVLSREECWRERISSCEASGLTVSDWCRKEGFSPSTYYRWKRILRQQHCAAQPVSPLFVELRSEALLSDAAPFASPSGVEVLLAGDRVLRVSVGFDGPTLASVVRILEALEGPGVA